MLVLYIFVLALAFLFSLIIIFVFIIEVIAFVTTDAPFVPVPDHIEKEIVPLMGLSPSSVLYDIGCGDGRVLTYAATQYPSIRAIGIEKAILPYLLALWHARRFGTVEIWREDFFSSDVSDATHIFTYLYPQVVDRIAEQIKKQCRPGTVIFSCDFPISTMTPIETFELHNRSSALRGKKVYKYVV